MHTFLPINIFSRKSIVIYMLPSYEDFNVFLFYMSSGVVFSSIVLGFTELFLNMLGILVK